MLALLCEPLRLPRCFLLGVLLGVAALILAAFGRRGGILVLLALGLGLGWLAGLLGVLKWKLNFLNFVALPITLGEALRGGKVTGVCNPAEETNASLSRLMIGAEPPALEHRPAQAGATVLRVQNLSLPRADQFGVDLMDVEFEVKAGEVVGGHH